MTDTTDWEPSEEIRKRAELIYFHASQTASYVTKNNDEIFTRAMDAALIAVRPLLIDEARPQIEAAERERIAKLFYAQNDYGTANYIRALKDSKP